MKKWYNKLFLNDIRAAVDDFKLIESGDKILVGLSGGKDSIFLLYSLILLREKSYLDFNIMACHIDIGINIDTSNIENFCIDNDIKFIYKSLDIKDQIFNSGKSPCYICSNYKRGAIAGLAKKHGANKLAYGHHLTDLLDTFYLNIVKENKFKTFKPISYNEKHQISLIRPLIYIREDIIIKIVRDERLPLGIGELCPYDEKNERSKVNKIVNYSNEVYESFDYSLLKAIKNSGLI